MSSQKLYATFCYNFEYSTSLASLSDEKENRFNMYRSYTALVLNVVIYNIVVYLGIQRPLFFPNAV